jgi:fused signal recognition particle receptor
MMEGILGKLKRALNKTNSKISLGLEHLFIKKKLDSETLEELEDLLLFADVGMDAASEIIAGIKKQKFNKEVGAEEIKQDLSNIICTILNRQDHQFNLLNNKLNVILVCGVNGNGKTTTIGKLASSYIKQGQKVAIAACDTFRAAAVEQIESWAGRSGADFYKGQPKADPASVAYRAITESMNNGTDILFIDTAGRLHNYKNLMDELAKIIRVIKTIDDTAPHHCLLVIDATTGQNALTQVEQFQMVANISGLVITKLDGTAKAGAVISIVKRFKLPIYFIGIGEGVSDLRHFSAENFSKALVGLE